MNQIAFHYHLTDEVYHRLLLIKGIKPIDFLTYIKLFDPELTYKPLSKVSLMYYVDHIGNFDEPPITPDKQIARAVFDSLDTRDKFEVISYIQHINL